MNKCHALQSTVVNQSWITETFFLNPFFFKQILLTPKYSWSFWNLQTPFQVHIKYFKVNLKYFPVSYVITT